jgi:hypothetical protein
MQQISKQCSAEHCMLIVPANISKPSKHTAGAAHCNCCRQQMMVL